MADNEFGDIFAIPNDIVFPDELNRYLKEQIAGFARENAFLQKSLHESEQKCLQMQKEAENLEKKANDVILPAFASSSSQTLSAKIVELSKNYRSKCAELEKYKTKCSKLVRKLEEGKPPENREENLVMVNDESLLQIKNLQGKLHSVTTKMRELKNSNAQLRNELRQTQTFLQQEVGENVDLQADSGWKGRAQIICDLQEKNRKLKEKLRYIQEKAGGAAEARHSTEKVGSKISALEKQNADLKSQNEAHKTKIESLKSRCGALETEHHELKLKMQSVKDRHDRNVELLANASRQLADAEAVKKSAIKEKDLEISKLRLEIDNSLTQIENYKALVNNFKTGSGKVDVKEQEQVDVQGLEEEKHRLLELTSLFKRRLENERSAHDKCQQLFRMEKQKAIRLEAAVARSELESGATGRSRYSTTAQSSKITENDLRHQLALAEENLKALQTRLQLEQNERKRDFQEFTKILSTSAITSR